MSTIEWLLLSLVLVQLLFVAPALSSAAGALVRIAVFYERWGREMWESDESNTTPEEVADEQ